MIGCPQLFVSVREGYFGACTTIRLAVMVKVPLILGMGLPSRSFNPLAVASAGHGAWQMTGERTFNLTYLNLTFDSFRSGNPTGTLKVRQTTKINKSGKSYTGSGDYTYCRVWLERPGDGSD